MKRNYRNLFMVGVMAFAACFTGCKEEEAPALSVTVNGSEEFAEEIQSTSASFTLKTNGISSVAYLVEEGNVSETTKDAAVVYAEAEEAGRVVAVVDGANTTVNVYSLEGGKEYTIFFVYTKDGKMELDSKVFTTPDYDRLITVVESKKDGFKFHFNVPDSVYYMYAFTMTEWYNSSKMYGHSDVGFLMDGKMLKGPQTVEINAGDDWIEGDEADWDIHPGSAYTLLMAQCDAEGNILYEQNPDYVDPWGGGWGPLAPATRVGTAKAPRMGDYTEEPNYTEPEYATGLYARQFLLADLDMVESKVKVEFTGKTERRIKIRCTADEDVQYVVAPMMQSTYNELVALVSEDAVPSTLLEYYGSERQTGTIDYEVDENVMGIMEVDSTYIISVVGVYADDASVLSYDTLQVTLTKSTLPAAEVTVTAVDANDPYNAWFNVKSEKQNVYAVKHVAETTKEVQKMLNSGYTYEMLLDYYGAYLSEEDVQAINSAEGLNLSIYATEDTEVTLLIGAFNEEEGMTAYTGISRSAEKPALAPVESPLFESLKGDWTARFIQKHTETIWLSDESMENWWTVDSVWVDTTYTTISLGKSFDNSPATFDESNEAYANVYGSLYDSAIEKGYTDEVADSIAKAQVAEQFAEYKAMVEKYENKYKGQNYILGLGLNEAHTFATPWDLFCASNYVAYNVEELFYAYGPKLFFQVQEDGNLQLLCDATMATLTPAATWGYYEFVVVGNNPENVENPYNGNFPVEVVDDNTLIIKGVDYDGQMCYPALGYWQWGWLNMQFTTCEDVVLTRGAADVAPATRSTSAKAVKTSVEKSVKGTHIKRTYLPTETLKVKTVKMNYVPVLDLMKEKYNEHLNK